MSSARLTLAFAAKELTFTIEGTGSYGAGLTAAVRRRDVGVLWRWTMATRLVATTTTCTGTSRSTSSAWIESP
jgi:hypothetical protein